MPGQDQTGPAGYGPGTGRGMGPCGKGIVIGRGFGQGAGRGFGRGRGVCRNAYPDSEPLSKEAQKLLLEAELKRIEAEKTEIQNRLTTFE
jgi:hypothetical protein